MKPLFSVPLLGCVVDVSSQELPGQHSFCVRRSQTAHTFSCDAAELRRSWLAALETAVNGRTSTSLTVRSGVDDGSGCQDEESVIGGAKENPS